MRRSPISILIVYLTFAKADDVPPIPIPVYTRGSVPNWFLPDVARENGITFLGSHARLRVAMDKASQDEGVYLWKGSALTGMASKFV